MRSLILLALPLLAAAVITVTVDPFECVTLTGTGTDKCTPGKLCTGDNAGKICTKSGGKYKCCDCGTLGSSDGKPLLPYEKCPKNFACSKESGIGEEVYPWLCECDPTKCKNQFTCNADTNTCVDQCATCTDVVI